MIAIDDGGDALQMGVRTMCSYRPPPNEPAREKQRRINGCGQGRSRALAAARQPV